MVLILVNKLFCPPPLSFLPGYVIGQRGYHYWLPREYLKILRSNGRDRGLSAVRP